ncbi:hypothetical protein D5F84_03500 [Streptococcus agalactiae]|nr:hypothetical protein A6J68_11455 [Streptococcus sp. 'group B']KAA9055802.1 hypothetical protein F5G76_02605 [Streptococcus agalactiae]KAA9061506.1 hypothetical protein F5G80_02750 [Streptococcus agalactiae]MBC6978239.1 hypothetical protein [Streptococcus agalactiae]MQP21792.1 hypothetical protein [Streptococcus agalactiae]
MIEFPFYQLLSKCYNNRVKIKIACQYEPAGY